MREKEFIKIDDLFKGRPDREEAVPPGAWNNMQALLDKAAAGGGGAAARGGRFGMYALVAVLTLSLGLGAVTWQHFSLKNTTLHQIEAAGDSLAASEYDAASESAAMPATESEGDNGYAHTDPASKSNTEATTAVAHSATAGRNAKPEAVSPAQHTDAPTELVIVEARNKKASRKNTSKQPTAEPTSESQVLAALQSGAADAKNTAASIVTEDAAVAGIAHKTTAEPSVAANVNELLNRIDQSKFAAEGAEGAAYQAVVRAEEEGTKFVLPINSREWKKEVKEQYTQIERRARYMHEGGERQFSHFDTVRTAKAFRTRLEPLSLEDKWKLVNIAAVGMGNYGSKVAMDVDAARASVHRWAASANQAANLVSISEYKVKSNNNRSSQSLAARFYDMMSKYFDGQKPFYFGGNVGAQAMFSYPLQSGFHIGAGAYYEFKERQTLGVELNYVYNTFANGGLVTEHYNTYRNQSSNNGVYTAIQQSMLNEYALKSTAYVELPVTMRYQLSKLSLLGGLYANYMTGAKYSINRLEQLEGEKMVSADAPLLSQKPEITALDFKERYGLGLTVGASYDFSKNISLDIRINQNLWSSVRNGSHLSSNLYRATGVQLSLFYFIGKRDKVIYMMRSK